MSEILIIFVLLQRETIRHPQLCRFVYDSSYTSTMTTTDPNTLWWPNGLSEVDVMAVNGTAQTVYNYIWGLCRDM